MDKRYQVFVSSTFQDLTAERQKVMQTLMKMDCIPSGMELFPADDEDQWQYIQSAIDNCDYYLLIIGGRYGSLSSDNMSYTEKEFRYAKDKGIRIIALLHADPAQISAANSESDPVMRERLKAFRAEVSTSRIRDTWINADDLASKVALGVINAIKKYPAVGWVRGDQTASTEILSEINELRKANAALQSELDAARTAPAPKVADLAGLDETLQVTLHFNPAVHLYSSSSVKRHYTKTTNATWSHIFTFVAPYLLEQPSDAIVNRRIAHMLAEGMSHEDYSVSIADSEFQTIKIQFVAHDLVALVPSKSKGASELVWSLTPQGEALMMQSRTVKIAKVD